MSAKYEIAGKTLIIRLQEDLDHHSAREIREAADEFIYHNNVRYLVFDFSQVEFMDSSGIGVIMGRYKQIIFLGGRVAVARVRPQVDRIFRISGLYKILEKYDSVEAACKQMQTAGR